MSRLAPSPAGPSQWLVACELNGCGVAVGPTGTVAASLPTRRERGYHRWLADLPVGGRSVVVDSKRQQQCGAAFAWGEVLLAPGPLPPPNGVAQVRGEFRSVLTALPRPLLHPGRALSVWRQAAPPAGRCRSKIPALWSRYSCQCRPLLRHSSNLGRRYSVVEVWVGSGAGAVVQVRVGIGTGTVVEVWVGRGTGTVVQLQVRVGMGTGAVVEVGW